MGTFDSGFGVNISGIGSGGIKEEPPPAGGHPGADMPSGWSVGFFPIPFRGADGVQGTFDIEGRETAPPTESASMTSGGWTF